MGELGMTMEESAKEAMELLSQLGQGYEGEGETAYSVPRGLILTAKQVITSMDWDLKLAIRSLPLSPPRKPYRSRHCILLMTRTTTYRIKSTSRLPINSLNPLPSFLHTSPLPPRLLYFRTDQLRRLAHRPSPRLVRDNVRAPRRFFLPFPSLREERRRQCRSSRYRRRRRT